MIRLLVSVRDVPEAVVAARAGVDFIDLKDPATGALGGLAPARIREILVVLRAAFPGRTVSATIGDLPAEAIAEILERVTAVGACGVDLVKVGVAGRGGPAAVALLEQLAHSAHAVVPVLIADHGLDAGLVDRACGLPFAAIMADTQAKGCGSLLSRLPAEALRGLISRARASRLPVGLAGALSLDDLPVLRQLAPDFAGFRSAVCTGHRSSDLCPAKLAGLAAELRGVGAAMAGGPG